MSIFSPSVVDASETLTRVVYSIHVRRKTKKIMPNLFSYAEKQGCSIQRESMATPSEAQSLIQSGLQRNPELVWIGVVLAACASVRDIRLDKPDRKIACVYDSAEKENPAHAEICWSGIALEEGDAGELRKMLLDVFDADNPFAAQNYRGGEVWGQLPAEMRDRKMT